MSKKNMLMVGFKAGDSAYYHHKCPKSGQSLSEQGIMDYARAPADFEPDLQKLAKDHKSLAALALAIEDYDESQLRILMWTLHQSHQLVKHGLKFGQAVYKNLSNGQDYLNCWFKCYVIGLAPIIDGVQYVKLTGSLDDIHGTLIMVPIESFLDHRGFSKHRKKLVAQGKLSAPVSVKDRVLSHKRPMANSDAFPTLSEVADRLVNAPKSEQTRRTIDTSSIKKSGRRLTAAEERTGRVRIV